MNPALHASPHPCARPATPSDRRPEGELATARNAPAAASTVGLPDYPTLRATLYRRLLDALDLQGLQRLPAAELRPAVQRLAREAVAASDLPLNAAERQQVLQDLENEVLGHGPLEPLLQDAGVGDILVNGAQKVWAERGGQLALTDIRFDDDAHLRRLIERIVSRVGRRIDEASPMVDARLPDGSRVNAIIPPLALDGPALSIRKFARTPLTLERLLSLGTLTPEIATLLQAFVKARVNLLISGGTGSGKTTLLNILSASIDGGERVVTIEDAAELQLQQPHVVRLETRPPNLEGQGEVSQRALVRNALRMRPDRIILGEVRGAEVFDMLQAMNTGHDGSMATVHANSARDALLRVETMLSQAVPGGLSPRAARQQIASALGAVLQVQRLSDGSRRLTSLTEITGLEGDVMMTQDLFVFEPMGLDAQRRVRGHFRATGLRPFAEPRLQALGLSLPAELFDPDRRVEARA